MIDAIEQQIIAELAGVPAKTDAEGGQGSEVPWTKYVKQALVDIGRLNGFKTAASGCSSDDGAEWLYDVVWYEVDEHGNMRDVPLVAECEWGGPRAIKVDFEKLLVARARYRVMIFQTSTDAESQRSINLLKGCITNCKLSRAGDRYLFLVWVRDHWATSESYVVP